MCVPIQLLKHPDCLPAARLERVQNTHTTRAIPTFSRAINIAQAGDIRCLFMILQQYPIPARKGEGIGGRQKVSNLH